MKAPAARYSPSPQLKRMSCCRVLNPMRNTTQRCGKSDRRPAWCAPCASTSRAGPEITRRNQQRVYRLAAANWRCRRRRRFVVTPSGANKGTASAGAGRLDLSIRRIRFRIQLVNQPPKRAQPHLSAIVSICDRVHEVVQEASGRGDAPRMPARGPGDRDFGNERPPVLPTVWPTGAEGEGAAKIASAIGRTHRAGRFVATAPRTGWRRSVGTAMSARRRCRWCDHRGRHHDQHARASPGVP